MLFCRVILLCWVLHVVASVSRPPSLLQQPPKEASFIVGEALKLPCEATANPAPKYVWYKNGREFNTAARSGRYTVWPGLGTLIFIRPGIDDDGYYQCRAVNEFGTSLSVKTNLRRVEFKNFANTGRREIVAKTGSPVVLRCQKPASYPPPVVSWRYEDGGSVKNIIPSSRTAIGIAGNLFFANVQKDDNGKSYQCVVTNPRLKREKMSPRVLLRLTDLESASEVPTQRAFGSSPKSNNGIVNETVQFICLFSGNPTPLITWKFVTTTSEMDPTKLPHVRVDTAGVRLFISKVLPVHKGTYRCNGYNSASDVITQEFVLSVRSKPVFIQRPEDLMSPPGSSVIFDCSATSDPKPSISWLRNGAPLVSDSRIRVSGSKLIMDNLVVKDSSVLQCNASNEYGYDFADFYINVVKEKPAFIATMAPLTILAEGQSVTLNCSTYSAPPAEVRWTRARNNQQLTGGRYEVLPSGNLVIKSLMVADSGLYHCTASNPFGSVSTSGKIEIRRRTRITVPPKDVRVYERSDVKFVCSAETDPLETRNLKITWIKDGSPINFKQQLRVRPNPPDNSLIIGGVGPLDTGSYVCVASNGIDNATASASLVVQGRPNPPKAVSVVCTMTTTKRQATVSWTSGSDNSAPVLKYEVEFANVKLAPETWYPVTLVRTATSASGSTAISVNPSAVVQMHPGITYRFRVRARNIVGISDPSPPSKKVCANDPSIPTKNPTELWAEGTRQNNIIVHWAPMSEFDQNGPKLEYIVTIKCLTCDRMAPEHVNTTTITNWRDNNLEFRNAIRVGEKYYDIEVYKLYEVTIHSRNSKGDSKAKKVVARGYSGEAAPRLKATGFSMVPKSAKNVDMNNQVTLRWNVPTDINSSKEVNGFFRGYRMEWCPDGLSVLKCEEVKRYEDKIINVPSHPLSMTYGRRRRRSVDEVLSRWRRATLTVDGTLTRLPGNITIKAWVRVLNKRYAGPPSNFITLKTAAGVPGPVALFKLKSRGVTHLTFGWQKPNQTNGDIVGYQMGVQMITALDLGYLKRFPVITDPKLLSGEVVGLKPKSQYRVFIWAETKAGFGVPTFLDATTSPAFVLPGAPSIAINAVGDTTINITYAPSARGVPGSVFYAQYRLPGRSKWEETYREFSRRWIQIKELPTDTLFVVRMVATNGAGLTSFSDEVQVRTGGSSSSGLAAASATWFIIILCLLLLLIGGIVALCYFRRRRYQTVIQVPQEDPDKDKSEFGYTSQSGRSGPGGYPVSTSMPPPKEEPSTGMDLPEKADLSGPSRHYENVQISQPPVSAEPGFDPPGYHDAVSDSLPSEEEWSRPQPGRRRVLRSPEEGPPRPPPPSGPSGSGSGVAINSSVVI